MVGVQEVDALYVCQTYLNQLRNSNNAVRFIKMKLEELYTAATSTSSGDMSEVAKLGCRVQTSHRNHTEDILVEMADMDNMLNDLLDEIETQNAKFDKMMNDAGLTETQQQVMRFRYCTEKQQSFETIKTLLKFNNTKTVWNLYSRSLAQLAKYMYENGIEFEY